MSVGGHRRKPYSIQLSNQNKIQYAAKAITPDTDALLHAAEHMVPINTISRRGTQIFRTQLDNTSTTHRRASTQAAACGWCTHKSLYPLHALSAPLHHLLSVDFSIPLEPSFYQLDPSFWKPAKTRRQESFFKSPRPHSGGHVRLATALARGADLARAAPDGTTALHAAAQVSSSRRVSS